MLQGHRVAPYRQDFQVPQPLCMRRLQPRPRSLSRQTRVLKKLAAVLVIGGLAVSAAPRPSLASRPVAATPALDLSQYRGKVVYLDFWASWCGPCRLSFPYMKTLTRLYSSNSFVVLAVNVDHARDKADAFLSQVGAPAPIIYDPSGAIAKQFSVKEMPTSILIGRDGRVRYVHDGFFMNQTPTYEAQIQELLNER